MPETLSSNKTIARAGTVVFVPSGSETIGGIPHESASTTASFFITMSGFAATGSNLNTGSGGGSGSYFAIQTPPDSPDGHYIFKFWFSNENNQTEPSSSGLPQMSDNKIGYQGGSVRTYLQNTSTGSEIVTAIVDAYTKLPSYLKGTSFRLSATGSNLDYGNNNILLIHSLMNGVSASIVSQSFTPWIKSDTTESVTLRTVSGSGESGVYFRPGSPDISKQAFSLKLEAPGSSSYMISSSNHLMYVSSSGKMGFNTTNPKNEFDIKVPELKFRNDDGTK